MIAAAVRWSPDGIQQDCKQCQPPPNESEEERAERLALRREWGCDGPAEHPWGAIECLECPAGRPRPSCPECKGSGRIELRTCPWQELEPIHLEVVAQAELIEHGLLPAPGTWNDQTATFVDAARLALSERARYMEVAESRRQQAWLQSIQQPRR